MNLGKNLLIFFLNLEKKYCAEKNIPFLEMDNETFVYDQKDILTHTCCFYENLYKKVNLSDESVIDRELGNCDITTLTHDKMLKLEGVLTYDEVSLTLKNMKNDKSPGCDGFTANFFKTFWNRIGHFVVRAINIAYKNNTFGRNQKLGIITCIPKENKPKHFLKNWRPITLLNVVYKLASGSIANRLTGVLDILVSKDQTGFIKNRYIGENTRLLYNIMKFTEDNNIPGLAMMIDFDTLSFTFIEKCLSSFQFGPMLRKWISLFLYNTETCVILNGLLSNFFKVERGCRQGDPISPYIFILCAEILAIKIRQSITIDGEEYKISQFADDTSLLLDGSEKSINASLNLLNTFSEISGLKINFDKTKIIWIGSIKYSTRSIKTKWKLTWGDTKFKLLG